MQKRYAQPIYKDGATCRGRCAGATHPVRTARGAHGARRARCGMAAAPTRTGCSPPFAMPSAPLPAPSFWIPDDEHHRVAAEEELGNDAVPVDRAGGGALGVLDPHLFHVFQHLWRGDSRGCSRHAGRDQKHPQREPHTCNRGRPVSKSVTCPHRLKREPMSTLAAARGWRRVATATARAPARRPCHRGGSWHIDPATQLPANLSGQLVGCVRLPTDGKRPGRPNGKSSPAKTGSRRRKTASAGSHRTERRHHETYEGSTTAPASRALELQRCLLLPPVRQTSRPLPPPTQQPPLHTSVQKPTPERPQPRSSTRLPCLASPLSVTLSISAAQPVGRRLVARHVPCCSGGQRP